MSDTTAEIIKKVMYEVDRNYREGHVSEIAWNEISYGLVCAYDNCFDDSDDDVKPDRVHLSEHVTDKKTTRTVVLRKR